MNFFKSSLFLAVFLYSACILNSANAEIWKIATLEFPPHTCQFACKENGSMGKALRAALESEGVDVEYHWLPWSRAINETKKGKYIGYFPSWPEDCQNGFVFSETIARSPFGVVERTSHPLSFKNAQDLAQYKIGVVQDYGNTREINDMIKKGIIKSEISVKDEMNIKKVALGRLDGALVDAMMLKHYLFYQFPELRSQVQFNPMTLENKRLGICLRKSLSKSANETLKKAFKKLDPERLTQEYMKKHFSKKAD